MMSCIVLLAFAIQLKKTPVICLDAPGFIVNHVARPYYLEALRLAEQEITDIATIDKTHGIGRISNGSFSPDGPDRHGY